MLERLDVEGETLTPDFRLSIGGNPVELKTRYVAVVDGTNGDTFLKTVEANFLQTTIITAGDIVDPPGPAPRKISLNITLSKARAEDLLRLVTKGNNMPLTGAVKLRAQLHLAGGKSDVVDRLALNGQFDISKAVFTNPDTQERIDALSRRGNGEPQNREISGVISNVRGTLLVGEGQAYFSMLEFAVPGATVALKGSYGLHTETLDSPVSWNWRRNFRDDDWHEISRASRFESLFQRADQRISIANQDYGIAFESFVRTGLAKALPDRIK